MSGQPLLTMRNIHKSFPGVKALDNVNFTLRAGEVHALVGENGAGKSTLIKVLTGVHPLDQGEILLENKAICPQNPLDAQREGISTVYQEVNLCSNLTVAENIFIGREPFHQGRIDWKTMNQEAQRLLGDLDLKIDVTKTLDHYSIAIQQMIAIARAINISARVIIFDEPTSSLDEHETNNLFKIIRQLKGKGMGIVFVTHFLEQIYELCNRVTILRNGELIGEFSIEELPRVMLISKMIGKDLDDIQAFENIAEKATTKGDVLLEAQNLTCTGRVTDFNVEIHTGEIIGFSGLLGSGRTETAELLFGVAKAEKGHLLVHQKNVKLNSPQDAMSHRIAMTPEDRKQMGIIGDLSVRENIILAIQSSRGILSHMPMKEQEKIADQMIKALSIKVPHRNQLVKNLSGGNQQKVIIARWLATNPSLLILDEPTRGIDIGTKTEIQKMVIKLAKEQGMSIVFISSEIDEMIRTCSRLVVFKDRKKVNELSGVDIQAKQVMTAIAGGK